LPSFIQELGTLVSEDNHLAQNEFNKILLSAVDEGQGLLGDSSKQAILFHLETSFQVKEENIPSNLTEFKKALDSIFGSGADYLEKIIVKRLHEKLGLPFEEGKKTDFLEYVKTVKSRTLEKGEITLK
jgi:hypothetical protein